MNLDYKIIFCGRTIYNEITVNGNTEEIRVGTVSGCIARFSQKAFNQDFQFTLERINNGWTAKCIFGVLFEHSTGLRQSIDFTQGDSISVYSKDSKHELFKVICLLSFENLNKPFDSRIDLRKYQSVTLGTEITNNIQIIGMSNADEYIKLENSGNYLRLSVSKTAYGVYVNGSRIIGIQKIKNKDFISCGYYDFFFSDGYLYISSLEKIKINSLSVERLSDSKSTFVYPKFNRNSRLKKEISTEKITVLDPPEIPKKPKENLLMTLFPSIMMLVLILILRGVMNSNMGMYIVFSACTMSLGIITSIFNYRKSKKEYKESLIERENTYKNYISRKTQEITEIRNQELMDLRVMYPDSGQTINRVFDFSGDLFDRTLTDDDFLHIRLGIGKRKSLREISYKKKESLVIGDSLQNMPENLSTDFLNISDAPIVVDLKQSGILGIVGKESDCDNLMKVIVEDICSRHFYKDVIAFLICNEKQLITHEWLKYLPHFHRNGDILRNIGCNEETCEIQFEYLFKILSWRETITDTKNEKIMFPAIVVFVLDIMGLYSHPISDYLKKAKSLNVYFIFMVRHKEALPLYCGNLIYVNENNQGTLVLSEDCNKTNDFSYSFISEEQMKRMALKLSPVYCEEVSVEGNLPKSFSLFSLLGIQAADDLDLKVRWSNSDVSKSLAAPLGLKSGNDVIALDLHENGHGPHGLVAGTTGSGKSELLQSYILSVATLFHPYEVGFVIIDFKGGGMAHLFADLPHLIGSITDIDGKTINRSLLSIKAEIDKRKKWFAEANVNNITDYISNYKHGIIPSNKPLPHLVLIIDEFAELKSEYPEFMKEVISAARVGRSLGVHLILATQKPAGIIDEQIWSNSRFKLCLKVQSKSDSNEVLKSPLASEIREPGRAYLKVGNNEVFELFQSAYSGCASESEEIDHIRPFDLYEIDGSGRRKPIYSLKSAKGENTNSETQLDAITKKIAQFCEDSHITKLNNICLPPLPAFLEYPSNVKEIYHEMYTPVGIYDDPSNQTQKSFGINVFSDNTLIIGSAMSGKTNLLQLVIRGVAEKFTPDEVTLYILDFDSMFLKNFEKLNHVGGVVIPNEDEKTQNLFKFISEEISTRKEKLLSAGVSNYLSYIESGYKDIPQIVLLVDNLSALKELYFHEEDLLLPICREGLSVGISVIIANSHSSGIGFKYFSNMNNKIALHCNESAEYHNIFDHAMLQPYNTPGRCIIQIEKTIYEAQSFIAFNGEKEADRVLSINSFIEGINSNSTCKAKKIPVVPEFVFESMLAKEYNERSDNKKLLLGLNFADVTPVSITYSKQNVLAVSGGQLESRRHFIEYLKQIITRIESEVYILDDYSDAFESVSDCKNVKLYSRDISNTKEILETIKNSLIKRYTDRDIRGVQVIETAPPIIFIINSSEAPAYISENNQILIVYKDIIKRYRNLKSLILFVNIDNEPIVYNSPEVIRMMKDNAQYIVFDDLSNVKLFECPVSLLKKYKNPVKQNEAFFLSKNSLKKIKTISEQ